MAKYVSLLRYEYKIIYKTHQTDLYCYRYSIPYVQLFSGQEAQFIFLMSSNKNSGTWRPWLNLKKEYGIVYCRISGYMNENKGAIISPSLLLLQQ